MKIIQLLFLTFSILLIHSCKEKNSDHILLKNNKVKLGQYLFFDSRLSLNHTKSCASCHSPAFAFTDGYRRSITALGENVLHNAPSLINTRFLHYFDWSNPGIKTLESQMKRPLYNHTPIELGLDIHLTELQKIFRLDSLYASLFSKTFPNADSHFTKNQIEECLFAYEQEIVSLQSAFDQHKMNESAKRGYMLFSSTQLNCITCHPPPYFTLASNTLVIDSAYANIGLYNVGNQNQYPANDRGIYTITKKAGDDGKFKIPSLRNVLLTAPYMHDGSVNTIEEVIDVYARGGRNITYGEFQGDGKVNRNKSALIKGFAISVEEKKDLISFLASLNDTTYKSNPLFTYPF